MKRALRWAGTVFGLLVFVLLVLIGVGTTLPVEHTATCSAQIGAPVDAVWKTVANPLDFSWRSDVVQAEPKDPSLISSTLPLVNRAWHVGAQWTEVDRNGQSITYQRVSEERDRHVVNRIADPTLPFAGTWRYDFTPAPSGTRVSVVEDAQIYNPVFRLVDRYFIGYTTTMRRRLTDLGTHFGQTPVVDCTVPPS